MQTITNETRNVLTTLRSLAPSRTVSLSEALRIAELQANRLLLICGIQQTPVPTRVVSDLKRVSVEYDFDMPDQASGASDWDNRRRRWVITINGHQPETRQRFTTLHEYKHIVDHGQPGLHDAGNRLYYGLPAAEFVADFFAGCLLMPRLLLKRTWGTGVQSVRDLAFRFDVSERAMEVRLRQVGFTPKTGRCRSGTSTTHRSQPDYADHPRNAPSHPRLDPT